MQFEQSTYFQNHMRKETDLVLNGSATPFKDTLTNVFQTTSNTAAIFANATAVGRIQSKAWLIQSCHEANINAISHDNQVTVKALQAKIEAMELEKAMQAQSTPQ